MEIYSIFRDWNYKYKSAIDFNYKLAFLFTESSHLNWKSKPGLIIIDKLEINYQDCFLGIADDTSFHQEFLHQIQNQDYYLYIIP